MTSPAPLADLRALGSQAKPLTLAGERRLPVAPALAPLLPGGGLRRGSAVVAAGAGGTSLGLALVGAASRAGSWVAAVGVDDLGMAAAGELGVDLERLVLVVAPPPDRWGTVVAALAEAFDVVLVAPTHRVRAADARRLAARRRERGGALVCLPGASRWPEAVDLTLTVTRARWEGCEAQGHGHLRARQVTVVRTGRGEAARPVRADLWLPGPTGEVLPAVDVADPGAGGVPRGAGAVVPAPLAEVG